MNHPDQPKLRRRLYIYIHLGINNLNESELTDILDLSEAYGGEVRLMRGIVKVTINNYYK